METVKRLSCKWKGQTGADEESTRSAGGPISRMPQRTKGGLRPTRHATETVTHPIFPNTTTTNPKIENILIQMKLDNKSDYTINFTRKALNRLAEHANLAEPEAVKMFIALLETSDSYKKNLCIAYNKYTKHSQIQWEMPKYTSRSQNIALSTKEKLLILISNADNRVTNQRIISNCGELPKSR